MLLEAWRIAERSFGSFGEVAAVEAKLPRKIKMRKMATAEVRLFICTILSAFFDVL
jgi:hypothetical protein